MIIALLILLGFVLLYYGAEFLVKGASSLAASLGVPPLVIGLTVVAFGTSMPELLVSVSAGVSGKGDIAIGNVVGSNIFNIALILGLAAIFNPLKVKMQLIKFDVPVMIVASLGLLWILRDKVIDRAEGILLFVLFLGYIGYTVYMALRTKQTSGEYEEEFSAEKSIKGFIVQGAMIVGGLGLLVGGSKALVMGAVDLAKLFGVSEAVIGLTIVAAGTSLPELATSVIAACKKEADISIGNIVGSNIFNILCILGASSMITPLQAQGISALDIYVMAGLSVITLPLMWTGFTITRKEGALLLSAYGGYLFMLLRNC